MTEYPQYYRKGAMCIKRESDLQGMQVEIPEEGQFAPLIHSHVTMPTKDRFDSLVTRMEAVPPEVYDHHVRTFHEISDGNRRVSEIKQKDLDLELKRDIKPANL